MAGTAVLEPGSHSNAPTRSTLVIIGLALLVAITFVALVALPYFTFIYRDSPSPLIDPQRFGLYYPKRGWLLLHIAGGITAILAGPVQLWLGLSDRRMDLHRRLGLAYIGGVAVGTFGAVALAVQTDLGWMFGAGLLGLALAWAVTTSLAFASIRRGLVEQHREWMIRSYVVTFAFVTFRVGDLSLKAAGIGEALETITFMSWVSWSVPLLVTEAILQSKKIFAVRRSSGITS
jgi:hypothetical protein